MPFAVDDITAREQRRAADPSASAWVSANAGAGKTKVLTDRVVRLLLAGAPPARILCLTFTKAAAANMSIRVFRKLALWVTMSDAALAEELADLTGAPPSGKAMKTARRLFARAVETPGGLRIETLHALCERLLHMFPFEANAPARFAVLDEAESALLFAEALEGALADAMAGARPDLRAAWDLVAPEAAGDALRVAIRAAMREREALSDPRRLAPALGALGAALGLAPGDDAQAIAARILHEGPPDRPALAARLRTGKATDEALADGLIALEAADGAAALDACQAIYFTAKGEPKADKSLGTKAAPPEVKEALLSERDRLVPLLDALRGARALERTGALFTLAAETHRRVEARKARRGGLDYDDLIDKALGLLSRVDSAWVLYKLDRGIDHVLVDEAQDTNPRQWEILGRITAEFAAGEGAREAGRTRFAVGDPKQSIYSFQGAEPRAFAQTRRDWMKAAEESGMAFADVRLNLSFRSVEAVLDAVDATFSTTESARGLTFEGDPPGTAHASARVGEPGAVELWPIAEPSPEIDPDAWAAPVDAPEASAPAILTARRIARAVRGWTSVGDESGRIWRPGEVLILVRKRSAAFEEVIRALKGLGVPVAGQDRLDIAAHIAVADLVAIGRAGLLPADDLTLAGALKTPLAGLDDDDLVRIAARRGEAESLEDALARHAAAGDAAAARGLAALELWLDLAARRGPFGFYAALLGPHGGRTRLVARLGGEAGDAIDVFLMKAAQAEEGPDAPSLGRFLEPYAARRERGESGLTIKRDLDAAGAEVRVMTIHGAKGLEAPLVVVIDGCEPAAGKEPPLLAIVPGALPVWSASKTADSAPIAEARASRQARAGEERDRLLYVALTRAADRLVIAPYCGAAGPGASPWCEMVRKGLEARRAGEAIEAEHGPVTLWRAEGSAARDSSEPEQTRRAAPSPPWLRAPVAPEIEAAPPVSPSGALGAADGRRAPVARQPDAAARRRGALIHALIEHLPRLAPARRKQAATSFVRARAPALSDETRAGIVADALRVIDEPSLAPLFADEARAEVTVSGMVRIAGSDRPVFGRVDRLAVSAGAVILADFKAGRPPAPGAPLPAGEAAQIALYAALLGQVYPGRRVTPLLVWTSGPVVRPVTGAEAAAAMESLASEPVTASA